MLFAQTIMRIPKLRAVKLFGKPIQWVYDARYHGVTFEKGLTCSKLIDQLRQTSAQRLGNLGPLLHRRSGLSIRNGVLLHKQLILTMMDYSCRALSSAARFHIKKLQIQQSKFFRIDLNAPW